MKVFCFFCTHQNPIFGQNFSQNVRSNCSKCRSKFQDPSKWFETNRGMFPKTCGIDAESNSESIPHSFGEFRRTFFIFFILVFEIFSKVEKTNMRKNSFWIQHFGRKVICEEIPNAHLVISYAHCADGKIINNAYAQCTVGAGINSF